MKRLNNPYIWVASFFSGVIVSYIASQFQYFEIKKELDIPQLSLSVITVFVGLFIAHTVQRSLNKSQNRYSYLEKKVDELWVLFGNYEQKLKSGNELTSSDVRNISKNFSCPLSRLSSSFEAFGLDPTLVRNIEQTLDSLENLIECCPISNNRANITTKKKELIQHLGKINEKFCQIMELIQEA